MPVRRIRQALYAKLLSLRHIGFLRSVGVLVGGTALAQAITVLVLPIATRLYTPSDFSMLAVFASMLSIVSVVACLRLEIAIPLPERDEDAACLLALALCSSSVVGILISLAVWIWPAQIARWIGQPGLQPFLWLLPLGIWLTSAYAAVQFWATRKKKFPQIAKTRLMRAVGAASAQLGFGFWSSFGPFGLLLGQVINSGSGFFELGRIALRENLNIFLGINRQGLRRAMREYNRFPKYATLEAFSNSAGVQLPIIIIAAMTLGPEAGYLSLAMRAMALPIELIGRAVGQVYFSQASAEMRAGRLAEFTTRIIGGLAKSGVGLLVCIGIVAPVVFPLLFGNDWQRAGELVAWMTPWFIAQFLASPVSMTMHVTGNQRAAVFLQIFGLILRVSAVVVTGWIMREYIVEAFAISGLLFYATYLIVVARYSGIKIGNLVGAIIPGIYIAMIWAAFGILSVLIIDYVN